jgi:autophagy-related protein 13
MHQRSRPPPITASPANSPRTNPARTNNARDQDNRRFDNAAQQGGTSEHGASTGEGSDTLMRGQEAAGHGKDSLAKMSQVIQVCLQLPIASPESRWEIR